jgi:hypothetical protein
MKVSKDKKTIWVIITKQDLKNTKTTENDTT